MIRVIHRVDHTSFMLGNDCLELLEQSLMRRSEQLSSEVARRQQEPIALDQTRLDLLAQIDDRLPLSERGQVEF